MTDTKIGPPPSPNRDKFPFVGTADFQGIKINLENLAGSTREGTDASGKKWYTKMRYHYGEIDRGVGTDGDKLDVYLGPNPHSKMVFIIGQNHPGSHPTKAGKFDEQKVMLGFDSADSAKKAYMKQYDRPDYFRSLTAMHIDKFKKALVEDCGEKIAQKRKRPSAFIRTKLRGSSVKEAYALGVKEAALSFIKTKLPGIQPMKNITDTLNRDISQGSLKTPNLLKNKAPAPTGSGAFPGSTNGATDAADTTSWSPRGK
jgi:hypothetical protein